MHPSAGAKFIHYDLFWQLHKNLLVSTLMIAGNFVSESLANPGRRIWRDLPVGKCWYRLNACAR